MMLKLVAGPNGLAFDAALGNIPDLWFGPLTPLWKAQWYGTIDGMAGVARVDQRLAGDFLCLPFGKSDLIDDPQHGWTSNTGWEVQETAPGTARLRLSVPVMGASVEKRLRLLAEAPLLYQTHLIEGGDGAVTLAHHPMIQARGARIAVSPKRAFLTPTQAMVPGAALLQSNARASSLAAMPGIAGPLDLTRYPEARCSDFLTAVEAPGRTLGWTAVTRAHDVVFVLKDPRVLPVTMLWLSNGGRDAAPWHGRHLGVLGVEDGIAAGADGHRAALGDNRVRAEGVATALTLGPRHVIRHVIGAVARPEGWTTVTDIRIAGDRLILTGDGGAPVNLPFDAGFFPA
jgi:hypothetical protein